MKKCTICKEDKPDTAFYKYAASKDGLYYRCKVCDENKRRLSRAAHKSKFITQSRKNNLKSLYNMSVDDYHKMLSDQCDCCAICGTTVPGKSKNHRKSFCVDHDHSSGLVRGLLCNSCNRALGLLGDDLAVVKKAAIYLENFMENKTC